MKRRLVPFAAALAVCFPLPLLAASSAGQRAEIELHVSTRGAVAADYAILRDSINARGESRAEAEAALEVKRTRIISGLAKFGIDARKVKFADAKYVEGKNSPENRFGFAPPIITSVNIEMPLEEDLSDSAAAVDASAEAASAAGYAARAARKAKKRRKDRANFIYWSGSMAYRVTVDDVGRLPEIMRNTSSGWRWTRNKPTFGFTDEANTHRKAIAQAFVKARAEADAYAAAMGYHVVRLARVSTTEPPLSVTEAAQTIMRMMDRPGGHIALMATHFAPVSVDYVIAPN